MRGSIRDYQKCLEHDRDYRHGCSHGSCSGGHLIHCLNAVFAVFGKMHRLATNETLSIFLVGVFSQNLNVFGLLAVSFAFAFPFGLSFALVTFAFSFFSFSLSWPLGWPLPFVDCANVHVSWASRIP